MTRRCAFAKLFSINWFGSPAGEGQRLATILREEYSFGWSQEDIFDLRARRCAVILVGTVVLSVIFLPNVGQKVIQEACKYDTLATGYALARVSLFNWCWVNSWRGPTLCYEIAQRMLMRLPARGYIRPPGSTVCRHIGGKCGRFGYPFSQTSDRK